MPTKDQHVRQSFHNHNVSGLLARYTGQALDWEVTTLFYSAVHMVEARIDMVMAKVHTDEARMNYSRMSAKAKTRHGLRQEFVDTYFEQAKAAYRALSAKCRRVRYECMPLTQLDVDSARIWHEEVKKVLAC